MTQTSTNIALQTSQADPDFLKDVISGLSQKQKTLSAKYFYDQKGSQLFEKICELPEYYVTRTEFSLLEQRKQEMANYLPEGLSLIEPGSGSGKKAAILLSAINKPKHYIPLEISSEALSMSHQLLMQQHPHLNVHPLQGDFTQLDDLARVAEHLKDNPNRLVFFPGSTIGNFIPAQAIEILQNLKTLAGKDGSILLGVDLIKNRKRLVNAYDDNQGVTGAFNLNLLHRINRELNGDFNIENGFTHKAVFNETHKRIEMHLVANRRQSIHIEGHKFEMKAGETIHTENSHKYDMPSLTKMAQASGLTIKKTWFDDDQDFAQVLLC